MRRQAVDNGTVEVRPAGELGQIREATRDGAPAIALINGDQLVEKLKELELI